VSWQQLFELSSYRTIDGHRERAPKARVQGPTRPGTRNACDPNAFARYAFYIPDAFLGRDVCVPDALSRRAEGPLMRVDPPPAAVVILPPASPPIARLLCNSKLIHSKGLSAPINPLESALTNSRSIFRISLKINGCQVLYNQHLRVFSPQPLWNQHLHKNTGGRRGVSSEVPTRTGPAIASLAHLRVVPFRQQAAADAHSRPENGQ